MKKYFFLIASFFLFSMAASNVSVARTAMLYEYVVDPSYPLTKTEKSTVLSWMIQNFDKENIPLVSIGKLMTTEYKWIAVDTAFKKYPLETTQRNMYWRTALPTDQAYPSYTALSPIIADPTSYVYTGENKSGMLAAYKAIADTNANMKVILVPITVTANISKGVYNTEVVFNIPKNIQGGIGILNVALVEAYHLYPNSQGGLDAELFLPVSYFDNLNGAQFAFTGKDTTVKLNYSCPVDKAWNTKYLYTVAWLALAADPTLNGVVLNAAVDKVVNLMPIATTIPTPVKLDITMTSGADFKKVNPGSSNNLVYTVKNSTQKTIKAEVYVDYATSDFPVGWTVSLSKDTVSIPAGQSTTVTAAVSVSGTPGVAGIDFAVRPIDITADAETPVITNKLAVLAAIDAKILIFSEKKNLAERYMVLSASNYSAYSSETGVVDPIYHSVIPVAQFDGYVFNYTTSYMHEVGLSVDNSMFIHSDKYDNNVIQENNNYLSTYLSGSMLTFVASAVTSSKHVALFADKSAWYSKSNIIPVAEKALYSSIFSAFGVDLDKDSTYYISNQIEPWQQYSAKMFSSDSLGKNPQGEALNFNFNISTSDGFGKYNLYGSKWTITAPTKASSVGYYESTSAIAMIKAKNSNQKLFLSGTGFTNLSSSTKSSANYLYDNIFTWWFGKKEILTPTMSYTPTEIIFDTTEVSKSSTKVIKITNTATDQGPIKFTEIKFDFAEENNCMFIEYAPTQIPAGSQDSIVIKFAPQTIDMFTDFLIIKTNTATPSAEITCSGVSKKSSSTAKEPEIAIKPADKKLDFGSLDFGAQAIQRPITISNTGDTLLTVGIQLISNAPEGIFVLENADFTSVKPINEGDASGKTFNVVFYPTIETQTNTTYTGKVEITTNDPKNAKVEVELTGIILGTSSITSPEYASFVASPNSISTSSVVSFAVPEQKTNSKVNMCVIDFSGQTVVNLMNSNLAAGNYTQNLDVTNLSSGNYYIELKIDDKRMILPVKIVK